MKFVTAVKKLLGRGPLTPSGVIVHATAGKSGQSSVEWLFKTGNSYHFIIERNGDIIVGVPKEQKAFHAGKSVGWAGKNCNDYTIGVSFANMDDGKDPITSAQYNALTELIIELRKKVPTLQKISTHYWISPGRKTDPVLFRPTGTHYVGLEIWRG